MRLPVQLQLGDNIVFFQFRQGRIRHIECGPDIRHGHPQYKSGYAATGVDLLFFIQVTQPGDQGPIRREIPFHLSKNAPALGFHFLVCDKSAGSEETNIQNDVRIVAQVIHPGDPAPVPRLAREAQLLAELLGVSVGCEGDQ